jgi:hypothetical protein
MEHLTFSSALAFTIRSMGPLGGISADGRYVYVYNTGDSNKFLVL